MWETIIAVLTIVAVLSFFERQTKQVKAEINKAREAILAEIRTTAPFSSPAPAELTSAKSRPNGHPGI